MSGETEITKAMEKAGYTKKTAKRGYANKSAQIVEAEIQKEFDRSKITPEYVLKEIERLKQLAIIKGDLSNFGRGIELLGRHLAMFTDKKEVNQTISAKDIVKELQTNRIEGFLDNDTL
jgi:hypothetical protein